MPDLNTLLKATESQTESTPVKKKFSRGIRPDHITRGETLPQNQEVLPPTLLSQTGGEPLSSSTNGIENSEQKLSQSAAKVEPELRPHHESKLSQSAAKVEPLKTNLSQIQNKVEPELRPHHESKLSQSAAKVEPKTTFSSLVGLQKNILVYVYNSCRERGSKTSGPIAISNLELTLNSTKSAVRKAIQRLEEKQCLKRASYKDGRGGWSEYLIPDATYSAILFNESRVKVESNISQTRAKVGTEVEPELRPSSPIVVVSSNSNNTTNTGGLISDEPCFVIPAELSGKVSRRQLSEFVLAGKISESDLQLSLDAFAYDLKNKLVSTKHTSNPVALLIGAIKNNGSYNSAKFIEALKSEMKPFIQAQQAVTQEKADQRNSKEWAEFQKFKSENPEEYKKLEEKPLKIGFTGAMLEDFTFLEYKNTILKVGDETNFNPLRPAESAQL